ncbi:hypothetical protein [Staphylococcus agnetis]|uniref:hypothetical protein n=1 Tax=Staphylococcus agnetis TaxID=985762 RepID=UPI0039EC728B
MKVKKNVLMRLTELINSITDNEVLGNNFENKKGDRVSVDECGLIKCQINFPDELFNVETESQIDENTIIPELLEVYEFSSRIKYSRVYKNESINNVIRTRKHYIEEPITSAFYILDEDMTASLLWKDGVLIDEI